MARSIGPISALLALAWVVPASAQTGIVTGSVTESGRPIVGAPVTIERQETVLTDQDGRFVDNVPAEKHTIRVELHGYQPLVSTLSVERDKTTILDFVLEPELRILSLTVPASLAQGRPGKAQVLVKNNTATAYAIDAAGLTFLDADGEDRGSDFAVRADASNPAAIMPGETAALGFTFTPAPDAAPGKVTVRASLFTFDTAFGRNLLANGSFEGGVTTVAPPWFFQGTNGGGIKGWTGSIVASTAVTGVRSSRINVPVTPEATEAPWFSTHWQQGLDAPLKPGVPYVLSGYIKTRDMQSKWGFGADFGVASWTGDWVTGTRDWRKEMLVVQTTADAGPLFAAVVASIQGSTGTAWFDNLSLTEGEVDGSLTVTGGDQTLEVVTR